MRPLGTEKTGTQERRTPVRRVNGMSQLFTYHLEHVNITQFFEHV